MLDRLGLGSGNSGALLFLAVGLIWLAFQVVGLMIAGIQFGTDSPRYIDSANALITGVEMDSRAGPYLGYIFLVSLFQWAGLGLAGVIGFQLLFALVALWAVFDLARNLAGSSWAGFWAALPVATFLDFTQWHRYVLTDSISASITVIGAWMIWRTAQQRRPMLYFAVLLFLVFGALVRPNGWLMVMVALLTWSLTHWPKTHQRLISALASVVIMVVVVPLTPSFSVSVDVESPAQQLLEGRVGWGAQETYRDMPQMQIHETGYGGVLKYGMSYPIATAALMMERVAWEMAKVRPYFSLQHNLYILAYLVPIYLLVAAGVWALFRSPLTYFILGIFGLHMALVAVTFADWDGRFLLYSWPLLCVLAGSGLTLMFRRWA